MTQSIRRPAFHESSEYFKRYIAKVESDDYLNVLKKSIAEMEHFFSQLSPEQWDHRYAEGKWSIKEVFLHLIDAERILTYRALRFARNDMTPLPGFEQDDYMPYCYSKTRSTDSVIKEYLCLRQSTIHFFESLDDDGLDRIGTASNSPFSVRALGFIIAGHEIHHLNIIKERYL